MPGSERKKKIKSEKMKRPFWKRLFRLFSILICFAAASVTVLYALFDRSFSYEMELYASDYASNYMDSIVNGAVLASLEEAEGGGIFSGLTHTVTDSEGRVASVSADMTAVTLLKARIDKSLADLLMADEGFTVYIPVGNILGGHLFYGKGKGIPVRIFPSTDVRTKMSGGLSEVGINQSLYRISFDVAANARIIFPFHYRDSDVKSEVVLSETVIVGKVPEAYTEFNLNGDISGTDLQGYVEDYGAGT